MIIFYDSANLVACKYTDIELDFITTLKTPSIPTFVSPAILLAKVSFSGRPIELAEDPDDPSHQIKACLCRQTERNREMKGETTAKEGRRGKE